MANEKHLEILKQGVEVWNRWREENPDIRPNLRGAELIGEYFDEANLSGTNLSGADLGMTHLIGADLSRARLSKASLFLVDLRSADLSKAILSEANLLKADFTKADLSQADLSGTNLIWVNFNGANLSHAKVGLTVFADLDLSVVKGLDSVNHRGPSTIGIDTIYRSRGKIPAAFLRGAGVPGTFIAYVASLTAEAIQYYSCFISYSSKDEAFTQHLHADLQAKGVHCWFAPEHMKIGDEIRPRIDASIRVHDKLLVVLSEHSIASWWVKKEVETTFEEENKRNQIVLFPVRLDAAVMETDQAWAADIRRTRHIGDFSCWKDHDAYQRAFDRLLRDLKAEVG